MKNYSNNECVNIDRETRTYFFGNTKFIVCSIGKDKNPDLVIKRLKKIAVSHISTKN